MTDYSVDEPAASRGETPAERYDRNWNEVLQELRVLQTGTQILTGFLLAIAFQAGFADLSHGQRIFYLVLVVGSALSAIFAVAPVVLHRFLFRRGVKRVVVASGHIGLILALVMLSLLLIGVVAFIFNVVVGESASWLAGACFGLTILVLWVVLPLVLRHRFREDH